MSTVVAVGSTKKRSSSLLTDLASEPFESGAQKLLRGSEALFNCCVNVAVKRAKEVGEVHEIHDEHIKDWDLLMVRRYFYVFRFCLTDIICCSNWQIHAIFQLGAAHPYIHP